MNDCNDELVSVIIPTLNAEAYLAETIESVLNQNWESLEILVVDDGSKDGSIAVASNFGSRVKILQGQHQGLAATRNRGMLGASGAYFLHLDSDDLLWPQSIPILMRNLGAEHDMVTGKFECFVSPELPRSVAERFVLSPGPQLGHLPGTSLVRAAAFRKFGGLDISFCGRADLEWWIRARDQGASIAMVEDTVLRRRIHDNNLSLRHRESQATSVLKTVQAVLQRRRAHLADYLSVENSN
jgi:glycosyltransferase involved in cell wall biosynthesis